MFRVKSTTYAIALAVSLAMVGGVAQADAASAKAPNDSAPVAALVVNLNTATVDELTHLPSIGPKKAAAIVALRQKQNGFDRLQDILRVKGIGRKTLQRLKSMLTLTGPTTLSNASRGAVSSEPPAKR